MTERVRFMRILKYEGSREWVEKTVNKSIQGIKIVTDSHGEYNIITAQDIDEFPEIIEKYREEYKPI